jgi:LCP family protein required for cell wall assembly
MERPKKTRRRRTKPNNAPRKRKLLKILVVIIAVVISIILVVTAFQRYTQTRNSQFQNQIDAVQNGPSDKFEQVSPDIPLYVLLVGIDDNNPTQANFIALAAVNKEKKHIDFIMLPDNTKIEGRKEKGTQLLSDIYSEGGLKLTQAVVEDIFHIPVPYYVLFTQDDFKALVDDYDGLSMYVERDMYHENSQGVTDIDLHQGYQHLNGEASLGYMRFVDKDGQLSRAQRQERFVKLCYDAMEKRFGITNMFHMYRFWGRINSNISTKDMSKLMYTFKDTPVSDITFYILPGETTKGKDKSLWTYDPIEVQKIIGSTNNAIAN